jgi:hypothetical protein
VDAGGHGRGGGRCRRGAGRNHRRDRSRRGGPAAAPEHRVLDALGPARLALTCFALEGHGATGALADPFNFLEGDEHIVPDGDSRRAIRGTGSGAFRTPFAAAWEPLSDPTGGRASVTACRFHRDAPIEGRTSLRFDLEIGPARPGLLDRYRSAAFYYTPE